tara:strand:- start:251 stop:445 length:195 start_codon:yes stop_codon:yes gene_type:complete
MHKGRNKQKCPKCRCKDTETEGNMVEPPDQWQEWNCKNCGWLVGLVDNSPYYSCYDFEDFVIDI